MMWLTLCVWDRLPQRTIGVLVGEREVRMSDGDRPNILLIWGYDIGISNLSCYS